MLRPLNQIKFSVLMEMEDYFLSLRKQEIGLRRNWLPYGTLPVAGCGIIVNYVLDRSPVSGGRGSNHPFPSIRKILFDSGGAALFFITSFLRQTARSDIPEETITFPLFVTSFAPMLLQ